MKSDFIHTFQNGNRCHLVMDFSGDPPKVSAAWDRVPAEEWPEIEQEYQVWRNHCFDTFMGNLPEAEKVGVIVTALEMAAKQIIS